MSWTSVHELCPTCSCPSIHPNGWCDVCKAVIASYFKKEIERMGFVQVGHAGADIKKGQRVSVCMEHGYVLPSADLKDCVDDPFGAECPGCERKKNERTCPVCGSREHLIKEHFIAGMRVMVCPKMKHDEWMLVRRK